MNNLIFLAYIFVSATLMILDWAQPRLYEIYSSIQDRLYSILYAIYLPYRTRLYSLFIFVLGKFTSMALEKFNVIIKVCVFVSATLFFLVSFLAMMIMDWAISLLYERLYAIYLSIRSRLVTALVGDDNHLFDLTTLERALANVRAELNKEDQVQQEPDQSVQQPDQTVESDQHDEVENS